MKNTKEILETFAMTYMTIQSSTDDVDLIDKEQEKLLDQTEKQLVEQHKKPSREEVEDVIVSSKYRQIFQDRMINAGFPGDTFKLARELAQALLDKFWGEEGK